MWDFQVRFYPRIQPASGILQTSLWVGICSWIHWSCMPPPHLPAITDIGEVRCLDGAQRILKDYTHSSHSLFTLLELRFFFPQAERPLNSSSTLHLWKVLFLWHLFVSLVFVFFVCNITTTCVSLYNLVWNNDNWILLVFWFFSWFFRKILLPLLTSYCYIVPLTTEGYSYLISIAFSLSMAVCFICWQWRQHISNRKPTHQDSWDFQSSDCGS